ncbi:MAG: CarD family transcriptional regulator [Clostridiales bacterium]|nr:CarD family transcriptional regulator [Clostridiales bacterium]
MFKVGEYVVYGMNGVCRVEDIGPMSLSGVDSDRLYYTLLPLYTKGSRVYTPVDNQKVVMRRVITKAEVCALMDGWKETVFIEAENDKSREAAYKEALRSCDCKEWIRIIHTTTRRKEERVAQGKKMSACDERYLKLAQDSLFGEFAVSLEIEKSEVESYLEHRLDMKEMASAS